MPAMPATTEISQKPYVQSLHQSALKPKRTCANQLHMQEGPQDRHFEHPNPVPPSTSIRSTSMTSTLSEPLIDRIGSASQDMRSSRLPLPFRPNPDPMPTTPCISVSGAKIPKVGHEAPALLCSTRSRHSGALAAVCGNTIASGLYATSGPPSSVNSVINTSTDEIRMTRICLSRPGFLKLSEPYGEDETAAAAAAPDPDLDSKTMDSMLWVRLWL